MIARVGLKSVVGIHLDRATRAAGGATLRSTRGTKNRKIGCKLIDRKDPQIRERQGHNGFAPRSYFK